MVDDELQEYQGINVGDKRPLEHKGGFGSHWDGYLDDTFEIEKIWITSAARASGIDPRTMQYRPDQINVRVRSVEHPEVNHTIGIERFL